MKTFLQEDFYHNSELLPSVMNELFSNNNLVQEHDMYRDGEFLIFAVYENASKKILKKVITDFNDHLDYQVKTVGPLQDDLFDFTVLVFEYERHFKSNIYWNEETRLFETKKWSIIRKVS